VITLGDVCVAAALAVVMIWLYFGGHKQEEDEECFRVEHRRGGSSRGEVASSPLFKRKGGRMHECKSHSEWLQNTHYMCPCGHVEWAHHGERYHKGRCSHCNCPEYRGEVRPLTEHELQSNRRA
jgi:hypothetical protein